MENSTTEREGACETESGVSEVIDQASFIKCIVERFNEFERDQVIDYIRTGAEDRILTTQFLRIYSTVQRALKLQARFDHPDPGLHIEIRQLFWTRNDTPRLDWEPCYNGIWFPVNTIKHLGYDKTTDNDNTGGSNKRDNNNDLGNDSYASRDNNGTCFPNVGSSVLKVYVKSLGYDGTCSDDETRGSNNTSQATMASEPGKKPKQEAEQVGLKVCLMSTQSLFENRQSLPEKTFAKVMDTTKKILGRTQRDQETR